MKKILLTIITFTTILLSQETTTSFFTLYEQNRQEQIPNYISLDFILTANYLFKQQSIKPIEKELYTKFKILANGLRENILKSYTPKDKEALAYVVVLNRLLDSNSSEAIPKEVQTLAKQELALIDAHKSITASPINKVAIDYSQFVVRGKYKQSAELKSYFRALKYMSYMPFMVNPHSATGITPQIAKEQIENATIIANALKPMLELYKEIEESIYLLGGKGDDLSLVRVLDKRTYALVIQLSEAEEHQIYLNSLKEYPKISERIIDTRLIKVEDIPRASLALKLLPSRFSPDSYIFSSLTYPNVGEIKSTKDKLSTYIDGKWVRGYPTINDISAVLVSKYPKEQHYKGYDEVVKKLQKEITYPKDHFYGYDFAIYKTLLEQNRTNSFKGYYTQSRYILNLYQKQSYTGGLKSLFFDERTHAVMESNMSEVLDLLIAEEKLLPNSKDFIEILEKIKELDKKQNKFTKKDIKFLNNLDYRFKSILDEKDSPISVDIHTNPSDGKILYETLDNPIVKMMGEARGAFYNHREEILGERE